MPAKKTTACPAKWGRGAWVALHMLTAAYPDKPTAKDRSMFRFVFQSWSTSWSSCRATTGVGRAFYEQSLGDAA